MSDIVRKLEKHPGWGIVESSPAAEDKGSVPTNPVVVNGLRKSPFSALRRRPNFLDTGPHSAMGRAIPNKTPPSLESDSESSPLYLQYERLRENILGFLGGHNTPPGLEIEFEIPAILGNMLRASVNTLLVSPWSVTDCVDRSGEQRTDLIIDGMPRQEGEAIVTPRIIAHLAQPEKLTMSESGDLVTVKYSPVASLCYSMCVAYL